MKSLFIIMSPLLLLSACRSTQNSTANKTFATDSTIYVVPRPDTAKTAPLSMDELAEVDVLLQQRINQYNAMQQQKHDSIMKAQPKPNSKPWHPIITLSKYKRQYLPIINKIGEKEVWVNCFCNDFGKDWKKEIIMVMDGGNCYFHLTINLTTKTTKGFIVNG